MTRLDDLGDEFRIHFVELSDKERAGALDERGRAILQKMREHLRAANE